MASKEQLIQAMSARLIKQFDEAELLSDNNYFNKKVTTLPCKNTRIVTVTKHIPDKNNRQGHEFYTYDFIGHHSQNDHYDLTEISETILLIGFANDDISGYAPGDLVNMGFVPETGTNVYAIANMLQPDNYRLVCTDSRSYGPEYEAGHDGQPYYGPTYRDVFVRENLTVFDKIIAHRDIKIATETINSYVGD